VAEFCFNLLKQHNSYNDPPATTTIDTTTTTSTTTAATRDINDNAVFLLSTLCQLYLDNSTGKSYVYIVEY